MTEKHTISKKDVVYLLIIASLVVIQNSQHEEESGLELKRHKKVHHSETHLDSSQSTSSNTTAIVQGQILDSNLYPIAFETITLLLNSQEISQELTDAEGKFFFSNAIGTLAASSAQESSTSLILTVNIQIAGQYSENFEVSVSNDALNAESFMVNWGREILTGITMQTVQVSGCVVDAITSNAIVGANVTVNYTSSFIIDSQWQIIIALVSVQELGYYSYNTSQDSTNFPYEGAVLEADFIYAFSNPIRLEIHKIVISLLCSVLDQYNVPVSGAFVQINVESSDGLIALSQNGSTTSNGVFQAVSQQTIYRPSFTVQISVIASGLVNLYQIEQLTVTTDFVQETFVLEMTSELFEAQLSGTVLNSLEQPVTIGLVVYRALVIPDEQTITVESSVVAGTGAFGMLFDAYAGKSYVGNLTILAPGYQPETIENLNLQEQPNNFQLTGIKVTVASLGC